MMTPEEYFVELYSGLPAPKHSVGGAYPALVPLRDGTELFTKLYLPTGGTVWPAVLIRTPYGVETPYLALECEFFARHGYAVVAQDCRGTGSSQGEWVPFENEGCDGVDTVQWIASQTWSNGEVATYGHSYLTAAQWAMADKVPSELKTMVLSGYTTERYRQLYMNGMFRHDVYTSWAIGNSGLRNLVTEGLFQKAVQMKPHIAMAETLLGVDLPWYREWITNVSAEDKYWSTGFWKELREAPRHLKVPVLMIDGWYDQHLDGFLRDFRKLPLSTRKESRLVLGPWTHNPFDHHGDLEFPNSNWNPCQAALEWFNHHLKRMPYSHPTGGIETYIIGETGWKQWDGDICAEGNLKLFLYSSESDKSENLLVEDPSTVSCCVQYKYDPNNPVPTRGGAGLLRYLGGESDAARPSSVVQEQPGYRNDVISFLSDVLQNDLFIAGNIVAHLTVSSDASDTSFTAVVMEVMPDGTAYNIRDGITSLAYRNGSTTPLTYHSGETIEVDLELWPITWKIQKGSRLRVDISSSNFPAYHAHANLGGVWSLHLDTRIATQHIYCGGESPSYIEIPYVNRQCL